MEDPQVQVTNPRFLRQLDIFDPSKYENKQIEVIGAGGIGSFTLLALAKLGMKKIRVYDGDKVEDHNIPSQLHLIKALGLPKVQSIQALCKQLSGTEIEAKNEFWSSESGPLSGIVISALDHMHADAKETKAGRKELWEALKMNFDVDFYVDARIGGEIIRVLSIQPCKDTLHWEWYEGLLYQNSEVADLPCTGRNIIDVGFMVAAVITNNVRRFLKTGTFDRDIVISMSDLSLIKMEPQL